MNIEQINPYIRCVRKITRKPKYKTTKCPDARLFYITKGSGTVTVNGITYEFGENSVFLWNAGCIYSWNFNESEKVEFFVINFDYTQIFSYKKKSLRLIPQSAFLTSHPLESEKIDDVDCFNEPLIIDNFIGIKELVEEIYKTFSEQTPYCDVILSGLFKAVIGKIVKKKLFAPSKSENKLAILFNFLRKNYDKEISNKMLAEMIHYHPNYINNLMKHTVGTTLHSYIVSLRLNEAINLLENTSMSIEDISLKIGFKTSPHFTTLFKKHFGISPTQYRKGNF